MRGCRLLCRLKWDQGRCPLYGIAGYSLLRGFECIIVLKSMEMQSGHSEMSVILQVSAIEGCPLSGVPLYYNRMLSHVCM